MEYPVRNPEDWDKLGRLSPWKRVRRYLRNRRYLRRGNPREGVTISRVQAAVNAPDPTDVTLICVVRDGASWLPSFLAHYRKLGVKQFAFLDDQSSDNTRDLLVGDDVDVFVSNVGYVRAGYGLLWQDMLVDVYGRNRWYIAVDSDEYLVYPGYEDRPVQAFIDDLKRSGRTRALAVMIDIYPDSPIQHAPAHSPADAFPTDFCPLHDGDGYWIYDDVQSTAVRGGPRYRMFGANMRMTKLPLLFIDQHTRFNGGSAHGPIPIDRNYGPVVAILLHYKFPSTVLTDFKRLVDWGTHTDGSRFYRAITEHAAFGETLDLRYTHSRRFVNSQALIDNGFIKDLRA